MARGPKWFPFGFNKSMKDYFLRNDITGADSSSQMKNRSRHLIVCSGFYHFSYLIFLLFLILLHAP